MLPYRRRFRRRLLLPVGWVALGLLLPLSCWLLGRQPKQWRRESIIQMTLPTLRPDPSLYNLYHPNGSREYNPFFDFNSPHALTKIALMRPWRSFELTGVAGADSTQLLTIEAAVKSIQADTGHAGGVRVQLDRHVAYRQLVALLDMMNRLDQKKYWLDIVHRPTTFYAITPRPLTLAERRQRLTLPDACLLCNDVILYSPPKSRFDNLREPERRPQVLLTLAVAVLLLTVLAGTFLLALGTRR